MSIIANLAIETNQKKKRCKQHQPSQKQRFHYKQTIQSTNIPPAG